MALALKKVSLSEQLVEDGKQSLADEIKLKASLEAEHQALVSDVQRVQELNNKLEADGKRLEQENASLERLLSEASVKQVSSQWKGNSSGQQGGGGYSEADIESGVGVAPYDTEDASKGSPILLASIWTFFV